MKLEANRLISMATEFLFDRSKGIYLKRRHFDEPKAWTVRNEFGEYLTKNLEFEHSAGRHGTSAFKSNTEFDFQTAYQLATAYLGKQIREAQEDAISSTRPIRRAGTSPKVTNFDIYTDDTE